MVKICFTGHRPNKLGGYDWNSYKNIKIMQKLRKEIIKVIEANKGEEILFICGGALGIDQMAFEICYKLKTKYNNIKLEVAIPFKNQDKNWFSKDDIKRYREQIEKADLVTYVDKLEEYKIKGYAEDVYYTAKMQKRNEYMTDNSDIVIAVWDGSKGGTANCVRYAKKLNKEIIVINPKEI